MQAIGYYVTRVFVILIGLLPYQVIYLLSDVLFPLLWHIVRYRKEVVKINLKHAFPRLSEEQQITIAKDFYRYFLDLTLETFKAQTMTEKVIRQRVKVLNLELVEEIVKRKGSIILLVPHYNNWEMLGQRLSLQSLFVFRPIYKPLNNRYFDQMMYNVRSRFGAEPISIGMVLREMIKDRNRKVMTAFAADQKPIGDRILWVDFLNQQTAAFRGAYVIAQKLDQPLFYTHLRRIKRGEYTIEFELLTDDPRQHDIQELAEMFFRKLEDDIDDNPQYWLWTHRRWKRGKNHIYNLENQPSALSEAGSQ